jgi:hypothetical protein
MMKNTVSHAKVDSDECHASTIKKFSEDIPPDSVEPETNIEEHTLQDDSKAQSIILSMISIHNRLLLASLDGQITSAVFAKLSSLNYAFIPLHQTVVNETLHRDSIGSAQDKFLDLRLEDIYEFDQLACAVEATHPTKRIVVHTGSDDSSQATIAFLMGCHMMLSHGLGFEETYLSFRRLHSIMDPQSRNGPLISVKSCLRAFCRAKCFEWLTFQKPFETIPGKPGSIHIDEYLHCARLCC